MAYHHGRFFWDTIYQHKTDHQEGKFVGLSGTNDLNASRSMSVCDFEGVHNRRYNPCCGGKRHMRS